MICLNNSCIAKVPHESIGLEVDERRPWGPQHHLLLFFPSISPKATQLYQILVKSLFEFLHFVLWNGVLQLQEHVGKGEEQNAHAPCPFDSFQIPIAQSLAQLVVLQRPYLCGLPEALIACAPD